MLVAGAAEAEAQAAAGACVEGMLSAYGKPQLVLVVVGVSTCVSLYLVGFCGWIRIHQSLQGEFYSAESFVMS